jgi:hypothetical protein
LVEKFRWLCGIVKCERNFHRSTTMIRQTNREGNIMRCYYILEVLELQGVRNVTFQVALHAVHNPRMAAMVVSVSNGASLHDDTKVSDDEETC